MKVVFLSTFDLAGGAARAATRTCRAVQSLGVQADMLVQHQTSSLSFVTATPASPLARIPPFIRFALERLHCLAVEWPRLAKFDFSTGLLGQRLAHHPLIRAADIIHLHWICKSFLSIDSLSAIASLQKPIVWTLHDQWPITGGCHYSGSCQRFVQGCGRCPLLRGDDPSDLSSQMWLRKKALFERGSFRLVTCSRWLGALAAQSPFSWSAPPQSIPNPIDTHTFAPSDAAAARRSLGIMGPGPWALFVAERLGDPRKGLPRLIQALRLFKERSSQDIGLILAGRRDLSLGSESFPIHSVGPVAGERNMAELYAASDFVVNASTEDNLPNTVVESLACGRPVVALPVGGLPELVLDQTTGFLASDVSASALADAILRICPHPVHSEMRESSRNFALSHFGERAVAQQYLKVYQDCLAHA